MPLVAAVATLIAGFAAADAVTYSGRERSTHVVPPRIEASAVIDGMLDEPVWRQAAHLTGFSQYAPIDDRPAEVETDVAVWYSPTAIYFGIHAVAPAGTVRATLADRDKLSTDDTVQIFLSTFNDGRQAYMFGVNPLGVQVDGTLVESGRTSGTGFSGLQVGREQPDLTPDFVFQSKGRLTPDGFDVEIQIPFKSVRYASKPSQSWGVHVVRQVQASGHEDSWAPARRDASSFLAQSGTLEQLTGLHSGLVLDLNPVVTAKVDGRPALDPSGASAWRYTGGRPDVGANVRAGVTSNLFLNGTVNPDFSQVEADAGQLSADPRTFVFYPEKRPFFLDGSEQFTTPNGLVYTRRIVAPLAAAKLTGKAAGASVAVLSAVDDATSSTTGDAHPWFNILRVQRDVFGHSRIGLVYTGRTDSDRRDQVLGADGRLVINDAYVIGLQGAVSRQTVGGHTTSAPLWDTSVTRSGRRYAFRYQFKGIDQGFSTATSFFSRLGIVQARASNQINLYGRPGGRIEQFSTELSLDGIWRYDGFGHGEETLERKAHLNNNVTLRGGWKLGGSFLVESYRFDRDAYATYRLASTQPDGSTVLEPFVGTPRLPNLDFVVSVTTPPRHGWSASGFYIWGRDENFFEWSSARLKYGTFNVSWRPTDKLRADASYQLQVYHRVTDGTLVDMRHIPRVKVEYQLTRSVFARWVGEYDVERRDRLVDDSRTGLPIVFVNRSTGGYRTADAFSRARLQNDWLFSYQPTPGTVLFAGYSGTEASRDPLVRVPLVRTVNGFFFKASYLWRL